MLHSFYIDDCLKSIVTEEAVISVCQDFIKICAKGGFLLNEWVSNSQNILYSISKLAGEMKNLDFD